MYEDTGTGVLGRTINLGEWFEAPQLWRIQVQISTEDSITLSTYSASWVIETYYYVDAVLDCTNYQDYRVVDQAMLSNIIVANQMPDIKIIDFLTGLFKMFNLTAYVEDDIIIIKDLNSFYETYEEYDITEYVDTEKITVKRLPLYSNIEFNFKEPTTFLAKEFSERNGENFGEEEFNVVIDDAYIDGDNYNISLPFEKVVYERLNDDFDGVLTNASIRLVCQL